MSVTSLQPQSSYGLGQHMIASTGSRNDGHRYVPYGAYSPRHHGTQRVSSQTPYQPTGSPTYLHDSSSPSPAYYGPSGGESRPSLWRHTPGPDRDPRAMQFEQPFSLTVPAEPQAYPSFLPQQLEHDSLFVPHNYLQPDQASFNPATFSPLLHVPTYNPFAPPVQQAEQAGQAGHLGFREGVASYTFPSPSITPFPMGGGEFHTHGLVTENGNTPPPYNHPQEIPFHEQVQGGGAENEAQAGAGMIASVPYDRHHGEQAGIKDTAPMNPDMPHADHGPSGASRESEDDSMQPNRSSGVDDTTTDGFEHSGSDSTPMSTPSTSLDLKPGSNKRRGAFDPIRRQQTAETRKTKACIRCRVQKKRCEPGTSGQPGVCKPCGAYSKESKKTIHHIDCFRGKLTDVMLYRRGGLNLTRRWEGTQIKDVGDRENPNDIRTIQFTQGLCDEPITIKVVQFRPKEGDVTVRFWTVKEDNQELRKKKEVAPYCLDNIQTTALEFRQYIERNAIPAFVKHMAPHPTLAGYPALMDVVERTYLMALKHYNTLESRNGTEDAPPTKELQLMRVMFNFWFASRHTTGTAWICGEEKLGMKADRNDELYPLYNKVSLPRMILAQFDSINCGRLLKNYSEELTKNLELLYMQNRQESWFTIYLCTFILLREASWVSADRYRHARQNFGSKIRYSIPSFVEELQRSCNNILCHWHYYNCKSWPDPASPWDRQKSLCAHLSSEQYALVMQTMTDPDVQHQLGVWSRYKTENGAVGREPQRQQVHGNIYTGSQASFDWDHHLYWVSQMFETQWSAHPTYQRE